MDMRKTHMILREGLVGSWKNKKKTKTKRQKGRTRRFSRMLPGSHIVENHNKPTYYIKVTLYQLSPVHAYEVEL